MSNTLKDQYPHYYKAIPKGMTHLDISALLRLFDVTDQTVGHAIKKLLCAGKRGAKSREKDLKEARDSITRALELDEAFGQNVLPPYWEDGVAYPPGPQGPPTELDGEDGVDGCGGPRGLKIPRYVRADDLYVGDRIKPGRYNEHVAATIKEISHCASGKITLHYSYDTNPSVITFCDYAPSDLIATLI